MLAFCVANAVDIVYTIWYSLSMSKNKIKKLRVIRDNMIARCYRERSDSYINYGAKGIKVCDRWIGSSDLFIEDMGPTYEAGLSLDRIDNTKGYYPENCRWVSMLEQQNNRTNNVYFQFNGKSMTLPNWAKELGINKKTLASRIYIYKWDLNKAFTKGAKNVAQ